MKNAVPLAALVAISILSAPASAQRARARTPVAPRADSIGAGSAVALGTGIGMHFLPNGSQGAASGARWRGGILLDEPFRDAARLSAVPDQEIARIVSDVMAIATIVLAEGVDATLVPLLQGDEDLAWQASLAHSFAMGLTLSIGEVVKRAVGRARPFASDCDGDPNRAGCSDPDSHHSFYSLHTGVAFTSAGFSCAMHLSRSLYGDVAADGGSCAASLALATTTGLLRILSDRHYLSDVLVGAALGLVIGYLVPLAIVPERGSTSAAMTLPVAIAPMVAPAPPGTEGLGTLGVSVLSAF